MMKRTFTILALALTAISASAQTASLEENFRNPPSEARPRVWWHWMDGNISKDGIRKDIEWMERAGIGGFHQFDAGGVGMEQIVDERIPFNTAPWKDALRYAYDLATERGMETAVASAPGWSSTGGPWVKPEDAMKTLTWRTLELSGPGQREIVLPPLYDTPGEYQDMPRGGNTAPWSEYVATVAVRLPEGELSMAEMGAEVSSPDGNFTVGRLSDGNFADADELKAGVGGYGQITYSFDKPRTIRALTLGGGARRNRWRDTPPQYDDFLEASDDGISWKRVCSIPSDILPVLTMDIPATTARHFRLNVKGDRKISEFVLHCVTKVEHAEDKAGYSSPYDLSSYPTPESCSPVTETIDLTGLDKDGKLAWNVPEGRWRIYRFGMSLTGKKNHPASPEATGLEVDKLSPEAWEAYFKEFLRIYEGLPVQYILTDSYEAGQMTWTRNMAREFRARRGYDLIPWLPALTGQILHSSDSTERFLFDWRTTLGELIRENYDRLGPIARKAGMKGRYAESHENGRQFIGDGMDLKRTSDIPMSAIWMANDDEGSPIPIAKADIRESASVAHIYGQNIVAAESFTTSGRGGKNYTYCPDNMKLTADIALASGLNRFVIHESSHQPSDAHRPGLDLIGYGQWFHRHETWAEEARSWTDYLARSSYLLQQGRFCADVLYYYGEDTNITARFGHDLPDIPYNYPYDFISPYGLLHDVSVSGKTLTTESGMKYRYLVLDDNCRVMSSAVLRRILEFAKAGVPVCGTLPEKPASLTDSPAEFAKMLDELRPLFLEMPFREAVRVKAIAPSFSGPQDWAFIHRETENEDIYWIRNFSGKKATGTVALDGGPGQPRLLDPADGSVSWPESSYDKGGWTVNLELEENDAVFVVIGRTPEKTLHRPMKEVSQPLAALEGPWTLSFDSGLGAPQTAVFDRLMSYTESDDPNVRYYSGTVTYRKEFSMDRKQLKGADFVEIDLGAVGSLARVFVNGHDVGLAWKAPFRLKIPKKDLHAGVNSLEVKVINLWANRIIGDMQPGATQKWTWVSSNFFTPDSPLLPSGLLGPVTLSKITVKEVR